MRLYRYVGPHEVLERVRGSAARHAVIRNQRELLNWLVQAGGREQHRVIATYVIDGEGYLRLADRRSEHVACAEGMPVQAAGEMTFHTRTGDVLEISNQSTGYCPEAASWSAVEAALDAFEIAHPREFTLAIEFRRCPSCEERNVVKDGWYFCDLCGAELPQDWNFGGEIRDFS